MIRWLTKKQLDKNPDLYWHKTKSRFNYIRAAILTLKEYNPTSILEIGPGPNARIANIATTIDIVAGADITMDITNTPWGLGSFDCIVALQVFEHLNGKQVAAFKEAYLSTRKCLVISIPYKWKRGRADHQNLDDTTMLKWSDGIQWQRIINVGCRRLYIWHKEF